MAARSVGEINADIAECRAAISKIRTRGQSEGMDGASVGRASLNDLKDDLADLTKELGYADGTSRASFTPTIGTAT